MNELEKIGYEKVADCGHGAGVYNKDNIYIDISRCGKEPRVEASIVFFYGTLPYDMTLTEMKACVEVMERMKSDGSLG